MADLTWLENLEEKLQELKNWFLHSKDSSNDPDLSKVKQDLVNDSAEAEKQIENQKPEASGQQGGSHSIFHEMAVDPTKNPYHTPTSLSKPSDQQANSSTSWHLI